MSRPPLETEVVRPDLSISCVPDFLPSQHLSAPCVIVRTKMRKGGGGAKATRGVFSVSFGVEHLPFTYKNSEIFTFRNSNENKAKLINRSVELLPPESPCGP